MRHVRRLAILFGVLAILLGLVMTLGSGATPKQHKIAADLLELQHRWDTADDVTSLFLSLTNLPFRQGAAGADKAYVHARHQFLGWYCDEYYFISRPPPWTNDEWTFYHGWYWNGHRQLAMHKLLTISDK